MKRLHVHLGVRSIAPSVAFYTRLFAAEPVVRKPDYAKWLLDDPRVNFAISTRADPGLSHLGIETDNREELAQVHARLSEAGGPQLDEGETTCCYARSRKAWVADPQDIAWETFFTSGEATDYGTGPGQDWRGGAALR